MLVVLIFYAYFIVAMSVILFFSFDLVMSFLWDKISRRFCFTDRKMSGKSKDEQMAEKKQELEKRLQDVSGQLGTNKKQQQKKGKHWAYSIVILFIW